MAEPTIDHGVTAITLGPPPLKVLPSRLAGARPNRGCQSRLLFPIAPAFAGRQSAKSWRRTAGTIRQPSIGISVTTITSPHGRLRQAPQRRAMVARAPEEVRQPSNVC